ncbi:hypothetical protein [Pseudoalteromonas marina]|uniref:Uncharacterized protein n=2 Tax=Bacteria TaxID=2 RepID=A0ABT9FI74_9GAMM|nr:hypothetical protein [Pseudoalteromonas marina]MDP2566369.1 hypothetical protein [Pseudoalteromonas marina]
MRDYLVKNSMFCLIVDDLMSFDCFETDKRHVETKQIAELDELELFLRNSGGVFEDTPKSAFQDVFAHMYCMYMFTSLYELLLLFKKRSGVGEECIVEGLVLSSAAGEPMHYLVKLHFFGKVFYFDAYGVVQDLNTVKARYSGFDLSNLTSFDPDEESVFTDSYKDMMVSCSEMICDVINTKYGDLDIELEADYCDHFSEKLALELLSKAIK